MASLGLPGLGNFVAEFLTLVGAWQSSPVLTVIAAIGLVAATAYSLRIMQKIFYGPSQNTYSVSDYSLREKFMMVPLIAVILWLGLYPKPVLDATAPLVNDLLEGKKVRAEASYVAEPAKKEPTPWKGVKDE